MVEIEEWLKSKKADCVTSNTRRLLALEVARAQQNPGS
jgi:hypothetical protein